MSTANSTAPAIRYAAVTFDCDDPAEMGSFYGEALGLPVALATDDFVFLAEEGKPGIGFHRMPGYRRPTWPEPEEEKQAHIDLGVDDLDTAETWLVGLGAVKPAFQPSPERWRVLLDPAGHPFCISTLV